MEYLQGRALTNAIGNLNLTDAYAGALSKLGHDLEIIVEQV
jgi:starch phosphorylase